MQSFGTSFLKELSAMTSSYLDISSIEDADGPEEGYHPGDAEETHQEYTEVRQYLPEDRPAAAHHLVLQPHLRADCYSLPSTFSYKCAQFWLF